MFHDANALCHFFYRCGQVYPYGCRSTPLYVNQYSLRSLCTFSSTSQLTWFPAIHLESGKYGSGRLARIKQSYEKTEKKIDEALEWMNNRSRATLPTRDQIPPSQDANKASPTFRHLMLPPTSRHFDRDEYFEYLDSFLHPAVKKKQFPSVILYGTEGVGKSTIASTYIVRRYEEKVYDVVLWICAENHTTLRQSFTEIATRLGLEGANSKTPDENFSLVQQWFGTTGKFIPSQARNTQLSGFIILKLQSNRVRVACGL